MNPRLGKRGPQRSARRRPAGVWLSWLPPAPVVVALLLVLGLALVVRLLWIGYAAPDPTDGRFDDSLFYDFAGRSLAAARGYIGYLGKPTAQWPPGYPLMLAGIYKAFGHTLEGARLLNVFAGVATCLLVYAVGARVFSRAVGLGGALILAVFPSAVQYTSILTTETIFPGVLMLFLLLAIVFGAGGGPVSPPKLLCLGALAGAATLLRSESTVLLGAVFLALVATRFTWRRLFGYGALLAVGAVVVIAPWTIRNAISMDAFIPVSSGMGHTFLTGHREHPYDPLDIFAEADLQKKYSDLGYEYPELEVKVEQEALEEGLEYMFGHPTEELQHLGEKFTRFYQDDSDALRWINGKWLPGGPEKMVIIPLEEWDTWSAIADSYYWVVVVFFLVGVPFWFSLRDYNRLLLVLVMVAWNVAHLLFYPTPRYHAPLVPLFSLLAAYSLVLAWQRLKGLLEEDGRKGAAR